MTGYYTGFGNHDTPFNVRKLMTEIAMHFCNYGYTLRTGSSSLADRAFETGAGTLKEIYVPWNGWNGIQGISSITPDSVLLARSIWKYRQDHGFVTKIWDAIHPSTQFIFVKTMCMVLSRNLGVPSDVLICWTPNSKITGISAHPITLADLLKIPIFNLADPETEDVIRTMLRKNTDPIYTIENRRERCEKEQVKIFGPLLD